MCGLFGQYRFAGLTQAQIDRARLARDMLTHRGPDQAGEYITPHLYMGHRRLSILDTTDAGRQPMQSPNGAITITVNGEIYNYVSLRNELITLGYTFKSQSDSEVVLHGYAAWGADILARKMDGMYAICIFDTPRNTLTLIRDRVGIKPLFYTLLEDGLIWASELPPILAALDKQPALNSEALLDFLVYQYIPAPKTAYQDIYKLPAASILTLDLQSQSHTLAQYWALPVRNDATQNIQTAEATIMSLLRESVAEQLVSDVPLGVFLSGGIDSSAITAIATELHPGMHSFSIGFHDPVRDETPFATQVATHIGTNHHVTYQENERMDHILQDMQAWYHEPFGDTSSVPTLRVSQEARKEVTVALSGDGGDELFGGYRWYETFATYRCRQRFIPFFLKSPSGYTLPKWIPRHKGLQLLTISDPVILYARIMACIPLADIEQWREYLGIAKNYDPFWALRAHFDPTLPPRKAAQVMDFHTYLPDDILVKVDRMSMQTSLECRPPFLSQKLVEYAFSLPENVTYHGGKLKSILKSTLKGILPDNILYRGKQGFSVPPGSGWKTKIIDKHGSMPEAILRHFLQANGPHT